ncbi:hypothetical protein [Tritonibacter mobilis]|uniref:hypothetical protein n=1 Tax=Tritonibacter mobilis TaxID=379347 RepID=UPI0014028FAD|nr:hypothetical protein [Tritonibacter mobilis]NHM21092.1 hypothetical protein [Tritonibacter mobilis]NHM25251.1 hypothetical protein [Tritonibacter mobilis]
MQLSLDDPLWDHLPGASGVEDVRGPLSSLLEQWDPELCNTLLWDRLYHQESLYPATWAALPWLWQIAGRHADAVAPLFDFFAHLLALAKRAPASYCAYEGLPLSGADLGHWHVSTPPAMIPPADALFEALVVWIEPWAVQVCRALNTLIEGADRAQAAHYLRGITAWVHPEHESFERALGFLSDGWSIEEMLETLEADEDVPFHMSAREISFASQEAARLQELCPDLARDLRALVDVVRADSPATPTQLHPDQMSLFE